MPGMSFLYECHARFLVYQALRDSHKSLTAMQRIAESLRFAWSATVVDFTSYQTTRAGAKFRRKIPESTACVASITTRWSESERRNLRGGPASRRFCRRERCTSGDQFQEVTIGSEREESEAHGLTTFD
jgi:hypothetical protein